MKTRNNYFLDLQFFRETVKKAINAKNYDSWSEDGLGWLLSQFIDDAQNSGSVLTRRELADFGVLQIEKAKK